MSQTQQQQPSKTQSEPQYKGGDPTHGEKSMIASVDDGRILKIIASTARDFLLSLPGPLGGWTKYKLHDHIYNYLSAHPPPDMPIIRKDVYFQTWENLRTKFNVRGPYSFLIDLIIIALC